MHPSSSLLFASCLLHSSIFSFPFLLSLSLSLSLTLRAPPTQSLTVGFTFIFWVVVAFVSSRVGGCFFTSVYSFAIFSGSFRCLSCLQWELGVRGKVPFPIYSVGILFLFRTNGRFPGASTVFWRRSAPEAMLLDQSGRGKTREIGSLGNTLRDYLSLRFPEFCGSLTGVPPFSLGSLVFSCVDWVGGINASVLRLILQGFYVFLCKHTSTFSFG